MSHSKSERSNGHLPTKTLWFLCGPVAAGAEIQNISIDSDPFVVGRGAGISLRLQFKTVSGNHASFSVQGDRLIVQDLGSTNGTYVNGKRIDRPVVIGEEDLIHFAEAPFRVRCHSNSQLTTGTLLEDICDQALALVQFDRLMSEKLVVPHFQAVVDFATSEDVGYEVLGRGRVFGLESVASMFGAASQLNLEVELSQLLRWEGIRIGKSICEYPKLFVNTHPKELQSPGLVASLEAVREMASSTPIVLELHEAAITCVHSLSELAKRLADLDIELAYDDFGAGQARLAELASARPHYVKFDMCLIRNIDTADPNRLRMLRTLVTMVKDLGILSLAEGIETAAEAEACKELGFELAQGFYYGYPSATVTRSRVAGT